MQLDIRKYKAFTMAGAWIKQNVQNTHGRFILLGLTVGLAYLPVWLGYLIPRALKGKVGWFLILCMLGLAVTELWNRRKVLRSLQATSEDQLIGYLLITTSAILFPFCRFAIWPQSFLWLAVLIGLVLSIWGLQFFPKFILPTFFFSLTVYPRVGLISRGLWEFFTPYQFLELTMASATANVMQAVGFPAVQDGIYITFPTGVVEVGWGCNGLDMAISIAVTGLFMGILYKQKIIQMVYMIAIAVVISFLFNIPRLMLVTIAHVYWGPWWFNFWHGFWGGQIFVGVLLTIYYYVMMALIEHSKKKFNLS